MTSRQSLYQSIADDIERRLAAGEWPAGEQLPTEPALASEYDASRVTINKAVNVLAGLGLVAIRRGIGVFAGSPVEVTAPELAGLLRSGDVIVVQRRDAPPRRYRVR